jgi:predicted nucleic acid-binding protein
MKIYLDTCCLNRPFDDQSQERIRLETEAVAIILGRITQKQWLWLGSQALEIEIEHTPDFDQQSRMKRVAGFVKQVVEIGEKELGRARELEKLGFGAFDAVHLACAESGSADVFLTTDDRLLKTARRHTKKIRVTVKNPLDWLKEMI